MRTFLIGAFMLAAALGVSAHAQAGFAPTRQADGSPDFEGVWITQFVTQAERPPGMPGPIVDAADARALADELLSGAPEVIDPDFALLDVRDLAVVQGTFRTSLLVEPADGFLPLTSEGERLVAEADRRMIHGFDHPEERDNFERCLSGIMQAPIRPYPAPIHYQFVQTPDQIVIRAEDVQSLRIIHMNRDAPPDALRSRDGWSSGRWEGDTLVITTTHFLRDDPFRTTMARALVVTGESRVIERLTRVSPTELHYSFTIEDPVLYARPWRAEFSFRRAEPGAAVYEYACHEGNHSLINMLLGGRAGQRSEGGG